MAYPSVISTLATPQPTDRLNSPSHSTLHQNENSAILEIQRFVGLEGPASTVGTLDYDVRSPDSNGGGHVQTANKGGTGQTSFTKGDLLAGQSTSVLSKLAVGTDGQFLVADSSAAAGVKWGIGLAPIVRVYQTSSVTSSGISSFLGTWTRPSTLSFAVIEVVGGGGGGGGNTTVNSASGGGGAGGYSKKTVSAASLPLAASIVAGIGAHGGIVTGGAGSVGGLTLFGSVFSATGGQGGAANRVGGLGGIGSGGDLNIPGGAGTSTLSDPDINNPEGGNGGNNLYGAGGRGGDGAQAGSVGRGYGGGGGGASSSDGSDQGGGDGSDGVVIITEY